MKLILSVFLIKLILSLVSSFILQGTEFIYPGTTDKTFPDSFVGKKVKKSVAIKDKNQLWKFGNIPYEIEDIFNESQRKIIKLGMKIWEASTCIEFVERNHLIHPDYVVITKLDCGCCYVENAPRNRGRSEISLNDGCDEISIILHELGHVLGLHHEHEHPDRDQYVFINEYNVERGYRQEFGKFSYSEVDTLNRSYDYRSIMHYPEDAFARSKYVKTIVPKQYINGTKPRIGNQVRLSDGDISAVNKLYNCSDHIRTLFNYQGSITSPKVMNDSLSIQNFEWRIPVSSGGKVALKILSLNIPKSPSCMTDHLEVRKGFSDRGDILGRFCGNYTNLLLINEDMTVKYVRTQIPNKDEGFLANYHKICGGQKFIISNDPITLQSPNFPSNYQSNSECLWELTAPKDHKTTIHFEYFNLDLSENCQFDHIQIGTYSEEESPRIYCGKKNPWDIILYDANFFLLFVSDSAYETVGFSATITTVPIENSNDKLTIL